MKSPEECRNLEEIRKEIDAIDHNIITLIARRFSYVKEVVKYKSNDRDAIIAKKRFDEVIANNRNNAKRNGLNADVIEKIYNLLLEYFIEEEIKIANLTKK